MWICARIELVINPLEQIKIMSKRKYSPKVKFQIILETIQSDKKQAEIARAYDVDSKLLSRWKSDFLSSGHLIFESGKIKTGNGKQITDLENIIGKQAIEIALLKKFLGHYKSR